VAIDFNAGTLSVDGGPASAFSPADFVARLDAALDPAGDASFSGGALTLEARTGGVSVADDPAAPSLKAGRSFSHAFGLNDLIRSDGPANYETGLRTSDPHGFTGSLTLRLSGETGARLRDVTVNVPSGGGMADLLAALNAPATGVGLYGGFSLDGQGRLAFTATTSPAAQLSVASDSTSRGPGGPSVSGLFGIGGGVRAGRADDFSVRSDIASDGRRLAFAQFDAGAAVGALALAPGDGRGGRRLADAGQRSTAFAGGRDFGGADTTLSRYAAEFGGLLGAKAAAAESRQAGAQAVASEAQGRRVSAEGVNLDEELVQLTTYQQAYNASARLIQAAKELYDVLLELT
jgi:flagellar hook-associated protein 1 FlgK